MFQIVSSFLVENISIAIGIVSAYAVSLLTNINIFKS